MHLFEPKSVAIIGASATEGKVGHDILKNLVEQGFKGEIYPVNPKGGTILGKTAYASVSDIDATIELAVIVIPAKFVPGALKECAEKKIETAVIITAGFSEVHTEEGLKLEEEIKKIALESNMNIIGPNCLGILRPSIGMNASFAKDLPDEGGVALISQSGAMAVALMDASFSLGIGFSLVASIGNKALMDECDFLELCEKDPRTKVIGMYLESILDGERFLKTATKVAKTKHIVLLKSGVSEHGKKAASSHTGALAGNDAAIDAACVQTGIHRAHTAQELLDLVRVLGSQPPLLSPNIAIITNAGGPGILATDATEKNNLILPTPAEKTLDALKKSLPSSAGLVNPIDVIGDAGQERYDAAIEACADDPQVDGIAVLLTPQVMTPCEDIARSIVSAAKRYPLIPITAAFMGGKSIQGALNILRTNNVPVFDTPERAVEALASLRLRDTDSVDSSPVNEQRAMKASYILEGRTGLLGEDETSQLFDLYDLPLPNHEVAATKEAAVTIARTIGYPVVAKVSSPDIIHKTDVGGIAVNLQNDDEVLNAFDVIEANIKKNAPDAEWNGVLIQQFLPVGSEFIIGSLADPSFGPLIMVGLGGIYTELFRDTSFRIAPVNEEQCYEMLQELTSWKLLLGMRGKNQSDIAGLAEVLRKISMLVYECPQITELDINPVLVGENRIVIADVKVVTSE